MGHLSFLETNYNEFKILTQKQYVEEILIQRTVKTTTQRIYDKEFFDVFSNADKVSKEFFVRRRRRELEKVNEDVL